MDFKTLLFFILVYANQGISSLPGQCEYYLTRESWGLSASMIGLISLITGLAWYIKPLWGFLVDYCPISKLILTVEKKTGYRIVNFSFSKTEKYRAKYYLYGSYTLMLLMYAYIVMFGLNIVSLIITGLIINLCIGLADVCNDSQMVILEQKNNLQGKLQAVQWTSMGVAGLLVSIVGAHIASNFSEDIGYRVAYALAAIIPILTVTYLIHYYKEEPVKEKKKLTDLKQQGKIFLDKKVIYSILFIACFQLCPSFGTALMIKVRESMGVSKMFLGYLGATGTVLGIIGYALYYWKAHKFPLKQLLIFMVIFSAITNLFYLYIPNKEFLLLYNFLFGAFSGITLLTMLRFFTTLIPKGYEGMTYAIITSISNFCSRGSNLFGGLLYDNYGYNTNVIVSTVLTLCCLFFIPKLLEDN